MTADGGEARKGGAFAPLREPVFRSIWTASLLSNFGQLILGVGAAWEMTRLTPSASMVALVQTALMLPLMLVAVPAGAVADMFDRRKVAMAGLGFSITCAALLCLLAWAGLTSPWVLLAFCSLIGAGVALYSPSWQASISEQVQPEHLPAAVALGSISYNIARSFGPALGGLIVLAAGAKAAFAINAVCYVPLLLAFFFWRRLHIAPRLPPERIGRAMVSGLRFVSHAAGIRSVLTRAFLFGLAGATSTALAPLIAKDLLHGDASTYGLLLGAGGVGAVVGALMVSRAQDSLGAERATSLLAMITAVMLLVIGFSRSLPLTCAALLVSGAANILTIALCNVSVQVSAPRWVVARAISLFSSALTGGIAIGSVFWGIVANTWSVQAAVIASGAVMLTMPLLWRGLPLPQTNESMVEPVVLQREPEVALPLTLRSGPIVVEVDYRVEPDAARKFYEAMLEVQGARKRNGGFAWSLARDVADPVLWTERYHFPTWGDYLRMRDRYTQADIDTQVVADTFVQGDSIKRIRRQLERPFGSVRWRADSPDPRLQSIGYLTPMS
ncbi:MAG: MFS transporter [Novosphingobium sp.]